MKKALITGINGQDGSYLAEMLLSKGYEVHGVVRRDAIEDPVHRLVNIRHVLDRLVLHAGSVDNQLSVYKIIKDVAPDECYHLAAASFVNYSFEDEPSILTSGFNSVQYLLSSIEELAPFCRFYFAGSSEMFGDADGTPQDEGTRFSPRSIYGISKAAGYYTVKNYRRHHGLFACTGILYNHESPRRGYGFVTRKIASTVAAIRLGLAETLELGNIDAVRDWGYAPEYVYAMWLMLNHDSPDDYVIATGRLHSVREFLDAAFSVAGLKYEEFVRINPAYFRPDEEVPLAGDASKARAVLGWEPRKGFGEMVEEMVLSEIDSLKKSGGVSP